MSDVDEQLVAWSRDQLTELTEQKKLLERQASALEHIAENGAWMSAKFGETSKLVTTALERIAQALEIANNRNR